MKSKNYLNFIFVFFFCSFNFSHVYAQIVQPNVNENTKWAKWHGSNGASFVWHYIGKGAGEEKSLINGFVFRIDKNGNAEIWKDESGIHYLIPGDSKILTPIDIKTFSTQYGPGQILDFTYDSSASYFYITWGSTRVAQKRSKKMITENVEGVAYSALLESHGKILWKKTLSVPPIGEFVSGVMVSSRGYLLAAVSSEMEEGEPDALEIWNREGDVITRLPGQPVDFSWSNDGKEINYKWLSSKKVEKTTYKNTIYDENGNWVSGDQ